MSDLPKSKSKDPGRLSAEESVELTAQLAQLSRAGLRLPEGLRAAAAELPDGPLRATLGRIAEELAAGSSLEQVLAEHRRQLPPHFQPLLIGAIRSGRVGEVLEEFVDLARQRLELRRRVWAMLAYPVLLLMFMTVLFLFLEVGVVRQMAVIYSDFEMELPALTRAFIWLSGPAVWVLGGLAAATAAASVALIGLGRIAWVARVQHLVPLLGPLWRLSRVAQLARLLRLMLVQGTPLPEALPAAAGATGDGSLVRACRRAAEDVAGGSPLAASLAAQRAFPGSIVPLVEWGEQQTTLAEGFDAAAETFEGRARFHQSLLEHVALPVMFLVLVAFVITLILALLSPMVSLIQALS